MSLLVRTNRTKLQKALSAGHGVVELAEVGDVGGVTGPEEFDGVASGVWVEPGDATRAAFVSVSLSVDGEGDAEVSLVVDDSEDEQAPPVDRFGGEGLASAAALYGTLQGVVPAGFDYYIAVVGDATVTIESVVEQALG